ncbi:unnamed protein product [Rotaria sp. Silwood2]|nr:unnamed protein product [Rotaria sp. Silwood2]CAF2522410.1 unnamed protein product [Rotaria sp. Silwood2]CAF2955908.1 unnamed protein product [Rotaria sp. Silwood2]CAF4088111.1 unnamed protein product [Rotaria sp. Silwood2]CAF4340532.1 unnamed protein product [Rotaria sp. Silwood2]
MKKDSQGPRPHFFTPNEVSSHNTASDIWVSFLGHVYDLSKLVEEHSGDVLLKPIIDVAGLDISHWFDPRTHDIRHYIDPVTHCLLPYTPHGRFIHTAPPYPSSDFANDYGIPWWKDEKYKIGVLSKKVRFVRILNVLTLQDQIVEVCSEENMNEILERYLKYNQHAGSYTWKYNGEVLDMNKTLEENGIQDDDADFDRLKMRDDSYLQSLMLYYNDDLTEA